MRRPRPRLPRLSADLAMAIEVRVKQMLPQHQAAAEAGILATLRLEFGEELDIKGEAQQRRAVAMVRAWCK